MYMDEASFDWFEHLHFETPDERVVLQEPRVDEGVLKRLEQIVEIAPASVGRIAVERKADLHGELRIKPPEAAHDHAAVLSTLAADEHAGAYVPVVVVDRGRPGEVELGVPHLAHGAAPDACGDFCAGCCVCAAFALYAFTTFFVGSFLSTPTVMTSGRLWS